MAALLALVLQTLVAVWAQHIIGLDRVAAVGAFAILHELTLLQRDLKLLLVAIDLQQRWTKQAIRDDAQNGNERDDSPDVPHRTALVSIANNPNNREHVNGHEHDDAYRDSHLQLRSPKLRENVAH